jgi:redox-sensitive bicupin YhaK (pirin superfamily)
MIRIRRSFERCHFNYGWLDTYHTFSFGRYYDPEHMGFRALRVINEDRVWPRKGFGPHPHEDMEIVTYVLEGALEHQDSLGHSGVIRAGELQRMSAGMGIMHSEANASANEPVHLYQIWLLPEEDGMEPSYEQKAIPEGREGLRLVASPDGRDGSLTIHTDAALYLARLGEGGRIEHDLGPDRHAWLQVLRGRVELDKHALAEGDGAAISELPQVAVTGVAPSEILLFDLA